jgi:hypothetical protein
VGWAIAIAVARAWCDGKAATGQGRLPAPAVLAVDSAVANWESSPDHAVLAFRDDGIGPHALGTYERTIDATALATMVRADGPVGRR